MTLFLASVGFGLVTASVLAIAAVGFTLQFGVTDVLNLAYGAVMIAGAFLAYVLNQAGLNVWLGLVVAVIACSIGSVLLNVGVYAPFQRRGASPITMVIVSLGMTLIIEFGVQALAGGTSVSYTMSTGPSVTAGGLVLSAVQLVVIGLSLLVMAGTARAAAVHQARQGDAGHRRQQVAGPQLRHPDRPGDHHHLGGHRGAVRPGRGGLRDGRGQLRRHGHRPVPQS